MNNSVYLLFWQHQCSDHYYPDYHTLVNVHREKDAAVAEADASIAAAREKNMPCSYYVQEVALRTTAGFQPQTCYSVEHTYVRQPYDDEYNYDDNV
jgi:hypothetical protein